jgi:hypothetical protein
MFCVALFLMYRKRISIALPFLIVPMSFFIADIIHFAATNSGTASYIVKSVLWSKIVSTTLAGCVLIAIFELTEDKIKTHRFIHTLVLLISIKAVIYMALSLMDFLGIFTLGGQELVYNYKQAYESLTVIFIILFYEKYSDKMPCKYLYLCLNVLPMLFFDCRGAQVCFLFLWGMYFMKIVAQKRFFYHKFASILISFFVIITVSQFLGASILQAKFLSSMVHEKKLLLKLEKIWSFAEQREQLNFLRSKWSKMDRDSKQNEILRDNPSIRSKTLSAYTRVKTIVLAMNEFMSHPFFGIGSHKAYSIRFMTDGIHSYIPLLLASYGSFGFLSVLTFCAIFTYQLIRLGITYLDIFVLYGYIMLVMALTNQFIWWYSLLVVLAGGSESAFAGRKFSGIDDSSFRGANA